MSSLADGWRFPIRRLFGQQIRPWKNDRRAAAELYPFGIDVVLIEPVTFQRGMEQTAVELASGYREKLEHGPYANVYQNFVRAGGAAPRHASHAEDCARVILRALRDNPPRALIRSRRDRNLRSGASGCCRAIARSADARAFGLTREPTGTQLNRGAGVLRMNPQPSSRERRVRALRRRSFHSQRATDGIYGVFVEQLCGCEPGISRQHLRWFRKRTSCARGGTPATKKKAAGSQSRVPAAG